MNKGKVFIQNFGCKSNLSDSFEIKQKLLKDKFTESESLQNSDLVVINTCAVTDQATRQGIKAVKKALKSNPHARVLVTGCAAEVDPDDFAKISTDRVSVIGNGDKPKLLNLINSAEGAGVLGKVKKYTDFLSQHPIDREWYEPKAGEGFGVATQSTVQLSSESDGTFPTRAFFKIQEGCNAFCTYCIIPYGRGPSRSLSFLEILNEIQTLHKKGVEEVVLTATNLGDFQDSKLVETPAYSSHAFLALLRKIDQETNIKRVRLTSLDPDELTDELIHFVLNSQRITPHFHVSAQALVDSTLKRMKRKYRFEELERALESIRKYNEHQKNPQKKAFVGMDLITGFPGESLEDFELSLERLKGLSWDRLHVFPYSERAGTPATKLKPVVPEHERVRRSKVLRELSQLRLRESYQNCLPNYSSLLEDVLWEKSFVTGPDRKKDWISGYTSSYRRFLKRGVKTLDTPELTAAKKCQIWVDPTNQDVSFYLN